jgi:hypothetical protein
MFCSKCDHALNGHRQVKRQVFVCTTPGCMCRYEGCSPDCRYGTGCLRGRVEGVTGELGKDYTVTVGETISYANPSFGK